MSKLDEIFPSDVIRQLLPNFKGQSTTDPIVRECADFIYNSITKVNNLEDVEIEARLGYYIFQSNDPTKSLDFSHIGSLCVLPDLRELTTTSSNTVVFKPGFKDVERFNILKTNLLKVFHKYPHNTFTLLDKSYEDDTRVSYNEYNHIVECIKKVSLDGGQSSLNLYNPPPIGSNDYPLALRLAVKRELSVDPSFLVDNPRCLFERTKLRTSFQIGLCCIDLTEVSAQVDGIDTHTYEVEVEIQNKYAAHLAQTVNKKIGPDNMFLQIVSSLISTLRYLEELSRTRR